MKTVDANITITIDNGLSAAYNKETVYLYADDDPYIEKMIPIIVHCIMNAPDNGCYSEIDLAKNLIVLHGSIYTIGQDVHKFMYGKNETKPPITDTSYNYLISLKINDLRESRVKTSFIDSAVTYYNIQPTNCTSFEYSITEWEDISKIVENSHFSDKIKSRNIKPSSGKFQNSLFREAVEAKYLETIYANCGEFPCDNCIMRPICYSRDKTKADIIFVGKPCFIKEDWVKKARVEFIRMSNIEEKLGNYYIENVPLFPDYPYT